jgi:hypothetical protein
MKVTLKELSDANQALGELLQLKRIPPVQKFRSKQLFEVFKKAYEGFIQTRNDLMREVGAGWKNEQGQEGVPPEKVPEFAKKFEGLLKETVDLGPVKKIILPQDNDLSAAAFIVLEPLGVSMAIPEDNDKE